MNKNDLLETFEIGICPNCGRTLYAKQVYGMTINVMCPCEDERLKAEEKKRIEFNRKSKVLRFKKDSGLTPIQSTHTFDNFKMRAGTEKSFKTAMAFCENFKAVKKGLIFMGSVGSGKTHLACAIGNELLKQAVDVKIIRAVDLPRKIQATYSSRDLSTEDILKPLEKCELLIIDDLGADKNTDYKSAMWQSLIDYRINYCKPTVITTNLNDAELNKAFDVRTVDRLIGNYYFCKNAATSYRREKNNGNI